MAISSLPLACILLALAPVAQAVVAPAAIKMQVRAGFDSYYKTSSWLPLQISLELAEGNAPFEGWIEASFSNFADNTPLYRRSVQLMPPANRTVWLYLPSDTRSIFETQVRLVDRQGSEVESQAVAVKPLNQGEFLLGVVSDDNSALNYLNGERLSQPFNRGSTLVQGRSVGGRTGTVSIPASKPVVRIAHLTSTDFPPEGAGWDSLDGLALTDLTTQSLGDNNLNQASLAQAASTWLSQGRFLLMAGDSGLRRSGFLSALSATRLIGQPQTLTFMAGLSKVVAISNLPANLLVAESVAWPSTQDIVKGPDGRSLLSRRNYGLGTAWYIAAELKSLGMLVSAGLWQFTLNDYEPRQSYADLQRQPADFGRRLINEVNPSTRTSNLPESWLVGVLLLSYVVVLGPLAYFILSKNGKRELGWVVAPGLATLLALSIYAVGALTGGDPLVFSRLSIITLAENGEGRLDGGTTGLATIYSNSRVDFQLQAGDGTLSAPLSRSRSQLLGRQPDVQPDQLQLIQQGPGAGYGQVLLGLSDQRSFVVEQNGARGAGEGILTRLTSRGDELDGTLENRTGSDWFDITIWKPGSRIYSIPLIKNGETLTLNAVFASRKNGNLAATIARANSIGSSSYNQEQQRRRELYSQHKEAVLNTLLGPDGETLPKGDERVFVLAWLQSSSSFPLQIQGRPATPVDLTLLFEPVSLR